MIILLDTSTSACRLVVIIDGRSSDYEWEAGRTMAKGLLAFLDDKTGGLDQIQGIGVMRGPGSFTGLRIGLTVANTLADSLGVPIVGEIGEGWRAVAISRLEAGETDGVVLPFYGGEAHITKPKK